MLNFAKRSFYLRRKPIYQEFYSKRLDSSTRIHDVMIHVENSAKNRVDLIPNAINKYLGVSGIECTEILGHLRWLGQKYNLGQDMFLCGYPGFLRRNLAMTFADLCGLEVEYVVISKDTTENDLKQRKEIVGDSVLFHDQAPVRAAIHGRLLILDGIENAERNVLPTLNNLLENREMSLEDGRFLTPHDSDGGNIVKVHKNFRVIALGLPCPPYTGRSLDPPLRSRFQFRFIEEPKAENLLQFQGMDDLIGQVSKEALSGVVRVYEGLRGIRARGVRDGQAVAGLPVFSFDSLRHCLQLLQYYPTTTDVRRAIARCLPGAVHPELARFLPPHAVQNISQLIESTIPKNPPPPTPSTPSSPSEPLGSSSRLTQTQRGFLDEMAQDHRCGRHLCLLGPQGSGKSVLAHEFSTRFGLRSRTFPLYQEMSARDLLQRRFTNSQGNTSWLDSPLVAAARAGDLCLLDGAHRIDAQALLTLRRLFQDNEIDLPSGERLVPRSDVGGEGGIHPSFRVICLGELPKHPDDARERWIASDLGLSFHILKPFDLEEACSLSRSLLDQAFQTRISKGLSEAENRQFSALGQFYVHLLEEVHKASQSQPELVLSMRHVVRGLRTLTDAGSSPSLQGLQLMPSDVSEGLSRLLLLRYMPTNAQLQFEQAVSIALRRSSYPSQSPSINPSPPSISIDDSRDLLICDSLEFPRRKLSTEVLDPSKVPQPLYFHNPYQDQLLRQLLISFSLRGSALLLIGNQGVGKNKLVDRLLQLLRAERHYMQLHRDTSVQSLTLTTELNKGRIEFRDSPLVQAAISGQVLVADEVDKADNSVVCVLKTLVEDGEIVLHDGRRLVSEEKLNREGGDPTNPPKGVHLIHPNFRLIALANRPGFPFLGNNFFRECGDVFETHVVENMDLHSELSLLRSYAPSVDLPILRKLVDTFNELRKETELGNLSYPFSAREAVSVAKHLDRFPGDGAVSAVENILAYDALSPTVRRLVALKFQEQGIPVPLVRSDDPLKKPPIRLQSPRPLPSEFFALRPSAPTDLSPHLSPHDFESYPWSAASSHTCSYSIQSSRIEAFTEVVGSLQLASSGPSLGTVCDLASNEDSLLALTSRPLELHVFRNVSRHISSSEGDSSTGSPPSSGDYLRILLLPPDMEARLGPSTPRIVPLSSDCVAGQGCVVVCPELSFSLEVHFNEPDNVSMLRSDFRLTPHTDDSRANEQKKKKNGRFIRSLFGAEEDDSYSWSSLSGGGRWRVSPLGGRQAFVWRDRSHELLRLDFLSNQYLKVDCKEVLGSQSVSSVTALSLGPSASTYLVTLADQEQFQLSISTQSATISRLVREPLKSPTLPDSVPGSQVLLAGSGFQYASSISVSPSSPESSPSLIELWPRPSHTQVVMSHSSQRTTSNLLSPTSHPSLEVIDPSLRSLLLIPVPISPFRYGERGSKPLKRAPSLDPYMDQDQAPSDPVLAVTSFDSDLVATASQTGRVTFFETDQKRLCQALAVWEKMFPSEDSLSGQRKEGSSLRSLVESWRLSSKFSSPNSSPRTDASMPKHGKEDEKNEPHVGGNTWAGGTGGSDTAGLGGRGGPYRLDKGHTVHQVSEEAKKAVSEEARSAAKKVAQEALAKRLKEIKMRSDEMSLYESYRSRIDPQISQLRSILEEHSRRAKERVWLRQQSHGELDDGRLVDGLTGDRLIFKRRGFPEHGGKADQTNTNGRKRLHFVVDISGSMYRFNGQDSRLERMLEAVLLVLESLPSSQSSLPIDFSITGHSGDSPCIDLLSFQDPRPANEMERLRILQTMVAHSQFCSSGDHTLEATQQAVREAQQAMDSVAGERDGAGGSESFVFVVSDANFDRYGISPRHLSALMTADPRVQVHFILIASLGTEAEEIASSLPRGKAHLCFDSSLLPSLFRTILTESGGALDLQDK